MENCLLAKDEYAEKPTFDFGIAEEVPRNGRVLAKDFAADFDTEQGFTSNWDRQDFAAAVMAKFPEKKNCERAREEAILDSISGYKIQRI